MVVKNNIEAFLTELFRKVTDPGVRIFRCFIGYFEGMLLCFIYIDVLFLT